MDSVMKYISTLDKINANSEFDFDKMTMTEKVLFQSLMREFKKELDIYLEVIYPQIVLWCELDLDDREVDFAELCKLMG